MTFPTNASETMTSAPPCRDLACLDAADEIDVLTISFEKWERLFHQCIALLFLRTVVDDRDTRILDAYHMFHIDGAHLCKLYQMGRSCIDIGAAVDQQGHALFCRNQWSQWRTFNALDSCRRSPVRRPESRRSCLRNRTRPPRPCGPYSCRPRWTNLSSCGSH